MDKTTTLFNKNHISITRTENGKWFKRDKRMIIAVYGEDSVFRITRETFASGSSNSKYTCARKPRKYGAITLPDSYLLCKSELGFYYHKPVFHPVELGNEPQDTRKGITWTFIFPDVTYQITYLTDVKDKQTSIDNDTRPWQLVDGSMEEHFIFDLLSEVTKICNRAKTLKYKCYQTPKKVYSWEKDERPLYDAHEAKRQILNDLFGNPEGPKFQTNEEKILSHGFDLVTSFRKM